MSMYHQVLKPLMFRLDAENAHHKTMSLLRLASRMPGGKALLRKQFTSDHSRLRRQVMGIDFQNPVGLAAGFDKDGKYIDLLPLLGFGFAEIGTVTPRPQAGNPKPRLFRLPADEALINRMGFNNEGVDAMVRRLDQREDRNFVIGGNIGKNKDTPNEEAHRDYVTCFTRLRSLVDFFVINLSSPNTPGLRELQNKESLRRILNSVQAENVDGIPVVLKIAPDIGLGQLDDITEVMTEAGLAGINCHNTTVRRDGLHTPDEEVQGIGQGGLSGKPLAVQFPDLLAEVRMRMPADSALIASGGVHDVSTALNKLKTGANLVEVYTGMIYQGPEFVREILNSVGNLDPGYPME